MYNASAVRREAKNCRRKYANARPPSILSLADKTQRSGTKRIDHLGWLCVCGTLTQATEQAVAVSVRPYDKVSVSTRTRDAQRQPRLGRK